MAANLPLGWFKGPGLEYWRQAVGRSGSLKSDDYLGYNLGADEYEDNEESLPNGVYIPRVDSSQSTTSPFSDQAGSKRPADGWKSPVHDVGPMNKLSLRSTSLSSHSPASARHCSPMAPSPISPPPPVGDDSAVGGRLDANTSEGLTEGRGNEQQTGFTTRLKATRFHLPSAAHDARDVAGFPTSIEKTSFLHAASAKVITPANQTMHRGPRELSPDTTLDGQSPMPTSPSFHIQSSTARQAARSGGFVSFPAIPSSDLGHLRGGNLRQGEPMFTIDRLSLNLAWPDLSHSRMWSF